jgi:heme oxygenase
MTNDNLVASMHHQLRQATKQSHHLLDHHPLLAPLVRQDLTVLQYGNALAALHGVQQRAEAGILAFLAGHPGLFDYQSRLKVAALESDLAALGRSPIGITTPFPTPRTVGALVGLLYVIEGSTQGGLMIARLLQTLPIAPLPIAYFSVYGRTSTQKWEEFLQFAERHHSSQEQEDAIATAVSAFEAIMCHMDASLCRLDTV